jgi:DNA repair protein RadC
MSDNTKLHYSGHRERLKQKFIDSPKGTFTELELLEMMLFWSIPRKDVKPIAKELISNFKNLSGVISASYEKLKSVKYITQNTYVNILLIKDILDTILHNNIQDTNIIGSWSALVDYLRVSMGNLKTETFRILFLNTNNILIADEIQNYGTVDQTPVYPREVIKRALFHEASSIILVHNHPSGNNKPSKADIVLTKKIKEVCKSINVDIHDHIIVSDKGIYSFKSNLLL